MPAEVSGIRDRVVVITGAARGMGRAYAEAFLEHGAHVVGLDIAWDADAQFPASSPALALACDVTSTADVESALARTLGRFGTVDVLINNAALRQRDLYPPHGAAAVLDTLDEHWQRMFEVNVIGVLKVIRQFVQPMQRQRRGSIVNISSNGSVLPAAADGPGVWTGLHPGFRNQPYDAAKAALTSLSLYLAEELRPDGIAVNVVFPAGTRTTGSDEMVAGRQALGIPVGALLRPEHVVPLVLHLSAQDASGKTGRAFEAMQWNVRHGHGGPDAWLWKTPQDA
jgi:NAD(P)-dependent dehydrogenase (short-subunit alcohol dehydrogenase family)